MLKSGAKRRKKKKNKSNFFVQCERSNLTTYFVPFQIFSQQKQIKEK